MEEELRTLHVLHFNDVYHAGSHNGVCDRAARFKGAIKPFVDKLNPLIMCCGDILAPSLMSTMTQGKHMMEVVELLGVHVGVLGNHDFDFGIDNTRELIKDNVLLSGQRNSTRWVMSNMDGLDGEPVAGCDRDLLLEWNGVTVGLIGVCEDWRGDAGLSASAPTADKFATWRPEGDVVQRHAASLRKRGADLVLVMTHSEVVNITPLVGIEGVDFVFGGHEHEVLPPDAAAAGWIISGCDFEDFSIVSFSLPAGPSGPRVAVERVRVDAEAPLPANAAGREIQKLLEGYDEQLADLLDQELGATAVLLQAKKYMLRTQETNVGSMLADAFRIALDADCAFLIAGIISSHAVIPPGPLTMRSVLQWFPWEGTAVLLEVPGHVLLQALEHGVSKLPRRDGRFPQVSGMQFSVDTSAPAGQRVQSATVAGDPIDPQRLYRVATNDFVAQGGDAYTMFIPLRKLVNEENGPLVHDVASAHVRRLCAEGPMAPEVEGRIRHLAPFVIDAAEPEGQRLVAATETAYDTYAHEGPYRRGNVNLASGV